MKAEEFMEMLYERHGDKYGILAPPISDKEGLDILIEHFLGDYYTANPISREQFNAEAIYMILEKYPMPKNKIARLFKNIFSKVK